MIVTIAIVFVVLTVISVPLAVTGGVASGIALLLFNEEFINPLMTIIQKMQFGVDNYTLLAIPLFILCGTLMNTSGITPSSKTLNTTQKSIWPTKAMAITSPISVNLPSTKN